MFLTVGHKTTPLARMKPLLAVIARFFFVLKKFLKVRLISVKRISAERPSDPANLNNESIIVVVCVYSNDNDDGPLYALFFDGTMFYNAKNLTKWQYAT